MIMKLGNTPIMSNNLESNQETVLKDQTMKLYDKSFSCIS